jgi:predicted adenylyl cyclase CyaB
VKNIEIKARCDDLDRARRIARELGATLLGVVHQADTYFRVAQGRLKLREVSSGQAQLIYYRRPDERGPKVSDYEVLPVAEAEGLRQVLAEALGVKAQVHKRREILLLEDVRIHLDEVEGLGSFIELEVVVGEGETEAGCVTQAEELLRAFGVRASDLVSGSYADLV